MNYICSVCGYIYEEAKESVPFAQLPDSWVCPLCRAPKSAFVPQAQEAPSAQKPLSPDTELRELSVRELAPLFSNLARGCEKQYKAREAELFSQIASYFRAHAPSPEENGAEALADRILENLTESYPTVEAAAAGHKDRGALRAYTWSLKVTRMQQAILGQYLQQGESFLEHTNIWVCSVCGFLYVGENPPALCPVCKVPDWKFEKIQGGAQV